MSLLFKRITHQFNPAIRERGVILRKFAQTTGLVYFGTMDQHKDDYDAIRGFTTSLSHIDKHYAVGTYNDYSVRVVDRFDSFKTTRGTTGHHLWTIFEIDLQNNDIPHVFFIPAGKETGNYQRLFSAQPHIQPLNALVSNHSPEFHGRYQILSRTTHAHAIDELFTSPLIIGIASRFWPCGIEIHNGKLYVYIAESKLTKRLLETTLASALWLAQSLDAQ